MSSPLEVVNLCDVHLESDPGGSGPGSDDAAQGDGRETGWRRAIGLAKGAAARVSPGPDEPPGNRRRRASASALAVELLTNIPTLPKFADNKDDNDFGLLQIGRLIIGRRLLTFAHEASVSGLVFLAKPFTHPVGSVVRRFMWTVLLLTGVIVMAIQIQGRISYYLSYPTMAKYQISYNASLHFPTVTVCMESRLRRQILARLGPTAPEVVGKVMPPYPDISFHPDYKSFNSTYWDVNWEDLYRLMAPPMSEVLIQCEFKRRPCKLKEAMRDVSTDLGFCFSFNPDGQYITTEPGATYGLRLVLWTNQSDYVVTWSQSAGFRILLHDPLEEPLMKLRAFKISPGVTTEASFTFRNVSQLPAPYGICNGSVNYTFSSCMNHCEGNYILQHCKCRLAESPVIGPVCNPEQVFECALNMTTWFISSGDSRKCDCALQCNQRLYPYSISTSPLSNLFLRHYANRSSYGGRRLNTRKLKRELAIVDIYYSKLIYKDIRTIPAYNILSLFADIGCSIGLILGSTVLTVVEIAEFVVGVSVDIFVTGKFTYLQKTARRSRKSGTRGRRPSLEADLET